MYIYISYTCPPGGCSVQSVEKLCQFFRNRWYLSVWNALYFSLSMYNLKRFLNISRLRIDLLVLQLNINCFVNNNIIFIGTLVFKQPNRVSVFEHENLKLNSNISHAFSWFQITYTKRQSKNKWEIVSLLSLQKVQVILSVIFILKRI